MFLSKHPTCFSVCAIWCCKYLILLFTRTVFYFHPRPIKTNYTNFVVTWSNFIVQHIHDCHSFYMLQLNGNNKINFQYSLNYLHISFINNYSTYNELISICKYNMFYSCRYFQYMAFIILNYLTLTHPTFIILFLCYLIKKYV